MVGEEVKPGDSGSLVVDAATRVIYGHVIGLNPLGEVYISPYVRIIEQIQRQLFPWYEVLLADPVRRIPSSHFPSHAGETATGTKSENLAQRDHEETAKGPTTKIPEEEENSENSKKTTKPVRYIETQGPYGKTYRPSQGVFDHNDWARRKRASATTPMAQVASESASADVRAEVSVTASKVTALSLPRKLTEDGLLHIKQAARGIDDDEGQSAGRRGWLSTSGWADQSHRQKGGKE